MVTNTSEEEQDYSYSDCKGPNSMCVVLISSDGLEIIIKREYAIMSGLIKAMLSGPGEFGENQTNLVHIREVKGDVLQKVCAYLKYKAKYTNSFGIIPEFPIEQQMAFQLLMAATYMDC